MTRAQSSEILSREEYPFGNPFDPSRRGYRVALVYPNTYAIGMSSLGFLQVYRLLNLKEGVVCERAFLPGGGEGGGVRSLETGAPLGDFDLIAFSLSYELDYPNVLHILGAAGVPLRRETRGPGHPLVMVGGSCPSHNPEPLAPFFDIALIGEAEDALGEVVAILGEGRGEGREKLLRSLASVEGVYLPSGYDVVYSTDGALTRLQPRPGFPERIRRRKVLDLDNNPMLSWVLNEDALLGDQFLIEIGRDEAGPDPKSSPPARDRSLKSLLRDIQRGLKHRKGITLVGPRASHHPGLVALCRGVVEMGGKVSIPSLRVDALSDELLDILAQGGEGSLHLALSAGSERMRFSLGEEVPDSLIFERVREAFDRGFWNLKLSLAVGLPGETDSDVAAIAHLAKGIRHGMAQASKGQRPLGRLKLCVSPFIPRPHTPMQWEPMAGISEIKRKLKLLSGLLKGSPNVRLTDGLPKWSYLQALLARGDRRVGELLLSLHDRGGDWQAALGAFPLNPDFYVTRAWGYEEALPWDLIDPSLPRDLLVLESQRYRKALEESLPGRRRKALASLGKP